MVNGLNNPDITERFILYPNPNNGNFTVEFSKDIVKDDIYYTVVDLSGSVCASGLIRKGEFHHELNLQLSDGFYFFTLIMSKEVVTRKIVIKK